MVQAAMRIFGAPICKAFAGTLVGHGIDTKLFDQNPEDPLISSLVAVPVACGLSWLSGSTPVGYVATIAATLAMECLPTVVGLDANSLAKGTFILASKVISYCTKDTKAASVATAVLASPPKPAAAVATSETDAKIAKILTDFSELKNQLAALKEGRRKLADQQERTADEQDKIADRQERMCTDMDGMEDDIRALQAENDDLREEIAEIKAFVERLMEQQAAQAAPAKAKSTRKSDTRTNGVQHSAEVAGTAAPSKVKSAHRRGARTNGEQPSEVAEMAPANTRESARIRKQPAAAHGPLKR